jgi:hypothetical protein
VANLTATTNFTVSVHDGPASITGSILVTVFEMPGQPVVVQQGDSLLSSFAEGNQWYNSSGLIEGATGQVFYPQLEDYYHVIVTSGPDCISEPSEPVYFLFTGTDETFIASSFRIWPTPVGRELFVEAGNVAGNDHYLSIINLSGQSVAGPWDIKQGDNQFHVGHLVPGVYLINIINSSGSVIYTKKLIR